MTRPSPRRSAAATGCSSSRWRRRRSTRAPRSCGRSRPSATGRAIDIGGPTPYVEFQQFFDAEYPAHTMRYYWKSSFADDLADDLIDHLVEAFGRRPSHHSTIDIWANGGAIARVSHDDSAFGQRTAPWLISPESNWESAADDAANLGWARDIVAAVGGSAYLNFPGLLEEGDVQARASHGGTFDRLAEVKRGLGPGQRVPLQRQHRAGAEGRRGAWECGAPGVDGKRRPGRGRARGVAVRGRAVSRSARVAPPARRGRGHRRPRRAPAGSRTRPRTARWATR